MIFRTYHLFQLAAVRKATEIKTNEVSAREDNLKSLLVKNTEMIDELDRLASELNNTGAERDVSEELQKASSSVSELSKLFSPPGMMILMIIGWGLSSHDIRLRQLLHWKLVNMILLHLLDYP